jgi:acyl-CoA synthetase (NDP forming)
VHRLLWPESIAVIGASADLQSISGRPVRILTQHGYSGRIYPVNPKYDAVMDLPAYPSVGAVPEPVDLAIVAVPAPSVVGVLRECAAAGVATAVVFSAGFAEEAGGGAAGEAELLEAIDGSGLRFLGPNSEGFINLAGPVPAGFSPTIDLERGLRTLRTGEIAVVAQSGGIGFALFSDGNARGLGFSHVVSTGNEADLDSLDFLDYLIEDPATRVILMFVEGFKRGRRFAALAERAAAARKPLVVAKVGRSDAGRRAAVSHTAHLAGHDAAYEAVFRRWGVLRARDQEGAVDWALALARSPLPAGNRVALVTLSGGAGVWAADALEEAGLRVPMLSAELQQRLRLLIPGYGSAANPVDVTAQVIDTAGGVTPVLEIILGSDEVDMVVLVTSLNSADLLRREGDALRRLCASPSRALLVYSYTQPSPESIGLLSELGLAWFTSSGRTAAAAGALCEYAAFLARGRFHTPPPATGRGALDPAGLAEHEAKELLRAWGFQTPPGSLATTPEDAARVATAIGFPVAVKIQSRAVVHKLAEGGVVLDLAGAEAVRLAAEEMLVRISSIHGASKIEGVLVEAMAKPGLEMILGALDDRDFGPLVMVGAGGAGAEERGDAAFAPAPLDQAEALELIGRLRTAPALAGMDISALADALAKLSELAAAHAGEFAAIDLNPVLIHPADGGVTVADAAIIGPAAS